MEGYEENFKEEAKRLLSEDINVMSEEQVEVWYRKAECLVVKRDIILFIKGLTV